MAIEMQVMVERDKVWEEVMKASDYIGSKMMDRDPGARERIFMTDADAEELGRLWDDARAAASEMLKEVLVSVVDVSTGDAPGVCFRLRIAGRYNTALTPDLTAALRSYFVDRMLADWCKWADKEEAEMYYKTAAEKMGAVLRMVYHRERPRRG